MFRARSKHVARWSSHSRNHSARPTTFGSCLSERSCCAGMRPLKLGELDRPSIMDRGVDVRARARSQAEILGGSSRTSRGTSGSFFSLINSAMRFDQAPTLHQPGDLGNHRDPGARLPPPGSRRAHAAERAAPGGVGLGDLGERIDDHAAGRKVRNRTYLSKRPAFSVRLLDFQMQRRIATARATLSADRTSPATAMLVRRSPAGWGMPPAAPRLFRTWPVVVGRKVERV